MFRYHTRYHDYRAEYSVNITLMHHMELSTIYSTLPCDWVTPGCHGIIARFPCWRYVIESRPSCHGYRLSLVTICNLGSTGLPGELGHEYYVSPSHRGAFYSKKYFQILTVLYRHSPTYKLIWRPTTFLKSGKNVKQPFLTGGEFFRAGRKAQWGESGGRILLGDNRDCGAVKLGAGVCISAWLPLWLTILYSIPTCAKLDLSRSFRNETTA